MHPLLGAGRHQRSSNAIRGWEVKFIQLEPSKAALAELQDLAIQAPPGGKPLKFSGFAGAMEGPVNHDALNYVPKVLGQLVLPGFLVDLVHKPP